MLNQPIQTVTLLYDKNKLLNKKYLGIINDAQIFRLFESWPTRIMNGKLYRSMILFGYDPYINDHDKKRWKQYEHKIKYGFQQVDFRNLNTIPKEWIKDENQTEYNDPLQSGKIYGWIPVYTNTKNISELQNTTNQYYIEGFNWLCEKHLHTLKKYKGTDKFSTILDGYYNLLGRKIPGTSGSRENISQNYILLNYDDTIIENISLKYDDVISWMEKNPRIFGFLIKNKNNFFKISRYDVKIQYNNKYDVYYARKQYPMDGL